MALRIVFFGTPDFAVASLDALVQNGQQIVGVVTAPDRPAGRGHQLKPSPVKTYALSKGLTVLQPTNLKAPDFLSELTRLKADLQIIVAFRMLPEAVWNMPPKGTFNLHASLLPQYRGAAPINWAIINGEQETGVSTFFLKHEIDTGSIIFQEKVAIHSNMNAGELHDKLMETGAPLVVKTVQAIAANTYSQIEQEDLVQDADLKNAPKIHKSTCEIDWNRTSTEVFNHIRGLSPYPTAWTKLKGNEDAAALAIKIFQAEIDPTTHQHPSGTFFSDGSSYIKVSCAVGFVNLTVLQQPGKKKMPVLDFLRGFNCDKYQITIQQTA